MKKIIAAVILAALAASPAMAKTIHHRAAAATAEQSSGVYAAGPGYTGSTVVTGYGMVLGQDPDPNVRSELERAPAALSGE